MTCTFALRFSGSFGRAAKQVLLIALTALVAACAGGPPTPDWQINAQAAMQRAVDAYLNGNARVHGHELALARKEIARTGRTDLLARAELLNCAAQIAALVFEPCTAFEALRQDAAVAELAYADYLYGRTLTAAQIALLPDSQRAIASAAAGGVPPVSAVNAIPDPLARLVASAALVRGTKASPEVLARAVETASQQGWRRPLLAWLEVQAKAAESAGDAATAARLRRRAALAAGQM